MQQRRAYWRRIVEEVRRSGQGVRAFCRERRVDEHRFYYWRRVLAKEECAVVKWAEEPRFLLVSPSQTEELTESNRSLELVVERGWRLRIPAGANESTLRVVLAALAAAR